MDGDRARRGDAIATAVDAATHAHAFNDEENAGELKRDGTTREERRAAEAPVNGMSCLPLSGEPFRRLNSARARFFFKRRIGAPERLVGALSDGTSDDGHRESWSGSRASRRDARPRATAGGLPRRRFDGPFSRGLSRN